MRDRDRNEQKYLRNFWSLNLPVPMSYQFTTFTKRQQQRHNDQNILCSLPSQSNTQTVNDNFIKNFAKHLDIISIIILNSSINRLSEISDLFKEVEIGLCIKHVERFSYILCRFGGGCKDGWEQLDGQRTLVFVPKCVRGRTSCLWG